MQTKKQRFLHAKFNKQNIHRIPKVPGLYHFHDQNGNIIYVGVASKDLRHRVESYNEKDDFSAHPTKQPLRSRIVSFWVKPMPISEARKLEEIQKQKTKFNADNKKNEAKKHGRKTL